MGGIEESNNINNSTIDNTEKVEQLKKVIQDEEIKNSCKHIKRIKLIFVLSWFTFLPFFYLVGGIFEKNKVIRRIAIVSMIVPIVVTIGGWISILCGMYLVDKRYDSYQPDSPIFK